MENSEGGLAPGLTGEQQVVVTAEMTAARFGNVAVEVLATPYLIWLLEGASVRAVHDHLAPGQVTVGTAVDVRHVAAVPVGRLVVARSRLVEVDDRRLLFEVEALHGGTAAMSGRHERRIVDLARFMAKAQDGKPGSP